MNIKLRRGRWFYQRKAPYGIDIIGPFETHDRARQENRRDRAEGRTVSPVYWAPKGAQ